MGGHHPKGHITDPRNVRMEGQAEDREEQRHLLREARAQKRLQHHRWNRICNSSIIGAYKKDV
jgi:hypothetical protein